MKGTHPTHGYDENAPHQAAISALVFELEDARDDPEDPGSGYTATELQSLEDTIALLVELRDGSARVTRPADSAPA